MASFRNLSIPKKIVAIIMIISGAALLLASSALILYDFTAAGRDLQASATVFALSIDDWNNPLTAGLNRPHTYYPAAHTPADLCIDSNDIVPARRWSLYTIRPAPGYAGALAIEGSSWRLRQWQWQMSQG